MKFFPAFLAIALLLSACAPQGISEEQAVNASQQFIAEHVKFFARAGNTTLDVPEYSFETVEARDDGPAYSITLHVTATLGNETKENDLNLKVDKRTGSVTEFNGQKLPG